MTSNIVLPEQSIPGLGLRTLDNGLQLIDIDTPLAHAVVAVQGGQVVEWWPRHQEHPVLWVSKRAYFEPGKAVRGGVPICWPWFGSHPFQADLPGHGYARVSPWKLQAVELLADGAVALTLDLQDGAASLDPWRGVLSLSVQLMIGSELSLKLTTRNVGAGTVSYTEGLHTYFQVGHIGRVEVIGLDAVEYVDLLDGQRRRRQQGSIHFDGELGRIYVDSIHECQIFDPVLNRKILVTKSGSRSTAVWNPWDQTATKMADLGGEGWTGMVCVESANALENAVSLRAGEAATLGVVYQAMMI